MRNLLLSLGLLLAVAATAGFSVYRATCAEEAACAARDGDALGWLRGEFNLNDAQFAEICRLHEAQSAQCAEHCKAVGAARDRLAAAERSGDAAMIASARAAARAAEDFCETSVEAHVRRVAAAMAPAEGARYLALVLPKISSMAHTGPPDVRLDP